MEHILYFFRQKSLKFTLNIHYSIFTGEESYFLSLLIIFLLAAIYLKIQIPN